MFEPSRVNDSDVVSVLCKRGTLDAVDCSCTPGERKWKSQQASKHTSVRRRTGVEPFPRLSHGAEQTPYLPTGSERATYKPWRGVTEPPDR